MNTNPANERTADDRIKELMEVLGGPVHPIIWSINGETFIIVASNAYEMADAMLIAREAMAKAAPRRVEQNGAPFRGRYVDRWISWSSQRPSGSSGSGTV